MEDSFPLHITDAFDFSTGAVILSQNSRCSVGTIFTISAGIPKSLEILGAVTAQSLFFTIMEMLFPISSARCYDTVLSAVSITVNTAARFPETER